MRLTCTIILCKRLSVFLPVLPLTQNLTAFKSNTANEGLSEHIRAASGENQQCGFRAGLTQTVELYKHRRLEA